MLPFQAAIPLRRILHGCRLTRIMVLVEADGQQISLRVAHEEPDSLETARITSPPPRARDTPRELFVSISIRHASCELEFRNIELFPSTVIVA